MSENWWYPDVDHQILGHPIFSQTCMRQPLLGEDGLCCEAEAGDVAQSSHGCLSDGARRGWPLAEGLTVPEGYTPNFGKGNLANFGPHQHINQPAFGL